MIFFPTGIIQCANSISCIKNLNVDVQNNASGVFLGEKVTPPKVDLADDYINPKVLGAQTEASQKIIYVDLTTQHVYAYEGKKQVYSFLISSGLWGPTPTGNFKIWVKLRSTTMTGGEGADYYNLPNVQYTMFFYNDEVSKSRGYSLHAAYWHNNFGHPMSHGCVNMRLVDAKLLYEWATPQVTGYTTYASDNNPGTQVVIYGTPPGSGS